MNECYIIIPESFVVYALDYGLEPRQFLVGHAKTLEEQLDALADLSESAPREPKIAQCIKAHPKAKPAETGFANIRIDLTTLPHYEGQLDAYESMCNAFITLLGNQTDTQFKPEEMVELTRLETALFWDVVENGKNNESERTRPDRNNRIVLIPNRIPPQNIELYCLETSQYL